MSAHPIAAIQSAADAAYPIQKQLESGYGDSFTVARDRTSGNVVLYAGTHFASIALEFPPMFALELSTALRRQAEVMQRESAARAAMGETP